LKEEEKKIKDIHIKQVDYDDRAFQFIYVKNTRTTQI